jgi:hypothetical protein
MQDFFYRFEIRLAGNGIDDPLVPFVEFALQVATSCSRETHPQLASAIDPEPVSSDLSHPRRVFTAVQPPKEPP